jgi:cytochrome c biogenesis protein CcdA
MYQQFQVNIQYKTRERRIFNALLTLATGVLTLIYPNFLYLIAGGYLVALGLMFLYFKTPPVIAVFPILTGLFIFLFPEVIPITMAVFLGFFGLILLLSFGFVFMGILTLIIAALIISNPEFIAYLIAAFLLLYGVTNLIKLFQKDSGSGPGSDSQKPKDRSEIIIE